MAHAQGAGAAGAEGARVLVAIGQANLAAVLMLLRARRLRAKAQAKKKEHVGGTVEVKLSRQVAQVKLQLNPAIVDSVWPLKAMLEELAAGEQDAVEVNGGFLR